MRIKLEQVYRHSSNEVPIIFIDARVSMYKILGLITEDTLDKLKRFNETVDSFIRANWVYLINNPLPYLKYPNGGFRIIIGDDFKNSDFKYWRSDYLPEYKDNRNPEAKRSPYESQIIQNLYEYAGKNSIGVIREEGFECDDIMGSLYRVKKELKDNRTLFMYTSDSDWMQLVDDDLKILFANAIVYPPRLRSEVEVITWAEKQKGWKINSPMGIVKQKYLFGDDADNIPALCENGGGIISLSEPLERPNELDPNGVCAKLRKELVDLSSNTDYQKYRSAESWLIRKNLPMVLV